ncbi:hypothetical protein EDB85DRAFT_1911394 [Lactarius pseudohatsudake]|nr:hypothetical protein EDB85DRAFT_1936961 [Lactarius pseudohatsudake]KAH9043618.1 hypothetical protein EDB85DRAFT_1911394 [Lactarius pseudohatsudake]
MSRTLWHMGKVVCRLRVEAVRVTRLGGLTVVLLATTVSSAKYGVCEVNCNRRAVKYTITAMTTPEPPMSARIQTFSVIHAITSQLIHEPIYRTQGHL